MSNSSFKVHSIQTHGEKSKCTNCDLGRNTSNSDDSYELHVNHTHDEKCKCTCDLGGNIANINIMNEVHINHTHGWKCVCTKCQNVSITSNDRKTHTRNHNSVTYSDIQRARPNNSSPYILNDNCDNPREIKK